ncbi:MAG: hypothetical protein DHS20C11_37540 [Lysobacteraceae bacterium]|nr:MAG: hypothetical protein DHS20C11_37540 [Xanthomonadaceae bacterium]
MQAGPFTQTFQVRWSDLDVNAHMRNTAYNEMGIQTRMAWFAQGGFHMADFEQHRIGPVIFSETIDYYREFRLGDTVIVDIRKRSVRNDGGRFELENNLFRDDGTHAARVAVKAAWLHLDQRKLATPPERLARLLHQLPMVDE